MSLGRGQVFHSHSPGLLMSSPPDSRIDNLDPRDDVEPVVHGPDRAPAPIHVLMASHMNCVERLKNFKKWITGSLFKQTMKPASVNIIMTVEDESLCLKCMHIIELFKGPARDKGIASVVSLDRDTRRSQFENYHELLCRLLFYGDEWLLFTDDDDEWHPERIETYSRALGRDPDCEQPLYIPMTHSERGSNYVGYAVRARVFKSFLKHAPPAALRHIYADVYWVRSLYQAYALGVRRMELPVHIEVLYHWRKVDYPTSAGARQTPATAPLTPLMVKRNVELQLAHLPTAQHTIKAIFDAESTPDMKYMAFVAQLLVDWDKKGVLALMFPDLKLFYPNDCAACGKPLAPRTCGRCGVVKYCSEKCQKPDWKRHKLVCKEKKKEEEKGPGLTDSEAEEEEEEEEEKEKTTDST